MPRSIRLAFVAARRGRRQAAPALPETPKKPVVDTYHGVAVPDDYRWLEADSDPAVKAWSDAENAVARDFLDAIPERKDILARVGQLTNARTPRYYQLACAAAGPSR
jgi:prolyl oligopeptidase